MGFLTNQTTIKNQRSPLHQPLLLLQHKFRKCMARYVRMQASWTCLGSFRLVEFVSDHVFGAESLNQLVFSLLESLNTNQQQIFCMTLWCIRYHRNQWIWETWIHNQQLQFISLCIVTMNGPMPMPSTDQIVILDNNNPLLLGQNLPRDFSRSISTLRSTNLPIHYILKGILNLERQRQWVFCMV